MERYEKWHRQTYPPSALQLKHRESSRYEGPSYEARRMCPHPCTRRLNAAAASSSSSNAAASSFPSTPAVAASSSSSSAPAVAAYSDAPMDAEFGDTDEEFHLDGRTLPLRNLLYRSRGVSNRGVRKSGRGSWRRKTRSRSLSLRHQHLPRSRSLRHQQLPLSVGRGSWRRIVDGQCSDHGGAS